MESEILSETPEATLPVEETGTDIGCRKEHSYISKDILLGAFYKRSGLPTSTDEGGFGGIGNRTP